MIIRVGGLSVWTVGMRYVSMLKMRGVTHWVSIWKNCGIKTRLQSQNEHCSITPMKPPRKCDVCGEDEYLTILKQTETHVQLGCLNCENMKEDDIYKNYYELVTENLSLKKTIEQLKEDLRETEYTKNLVMDVNSELKDDIARMDRECKRGEEAVANLIKEKEEAVRMRDVWFEKYNNCKNEFLYYQRFFEQYRKRRI